jgi:hypothetical protein
MQIENLPLAGTCLPKGLAEDLNKKIQYQLEVTTILYLLKIFIYSLYTGTSGLYMACINVTDPKYSNFINQVKIFTEDLWKNTTFFQKSLLYFKIVNDYSVQKMGRMLKMSPADIRSQFLRVSDYMNFDIKYDRLHEIILREEIFNYGD